MKFVLSFTKPCKTIYRIEHGAEGDVIEFVALVLYWKGAQRIWNSIEVVNEL